MTGLLKKDFYNGKKFLLLGVGLFLFGLLFGYLIRFSFIYGNLAHLDASEFSDNVFMIDLVFTFVPALLLLILFFQGSISSIYTDFSCKWHLYAFSTPLTPQTLTIVKFAELLFLWLVAFLLELGTGYIYGTIFGFSNAKIGMTAYCFLAVCILLAGFCMIPMSYRYRTQNGVLTRLLVGVILPVYLVFGVIVLNFSEFATKFYNTLKLWCISHKILLCGIAFFMILVVGFISYLICIRIIKRRDWVCGD